MVARKLHPYLFGLLLGLAGSFTARPTAAQSAPPTQQEVARAQQHADDGMEHYFARRYSKAIVEFLKGYELTNDPIFLYNISLAHQKLGSFDKSISALERVIESPNTPSELAVASRARISALERIKSTRDVADEVGEESTQVSDTAEPEEAGGLSWAGWTGIVLGIGGSATLVYAAILDAQLQQTWEEYETAGQNGDTGTYAQLREEIEQKQRTGKVLTFGGGAAAALGVTMLLIDLASGGESDGSASFGPLLGPRRAGAVVRWEF